MGRVVPKRTLDEIRFRCEIVEVINSYVGLKRAGSTYRALCPFHKEKTPSFHVNPQKQIFHCFGCGVGGDVFRFVMMYEGLDFIGAIKMLADRAGIKLELEEDDGRSSDKDMLFRIHAELAEVYHKLLLEDKSAVHARKYIAGRELSEETVKEFKIGFAPAGWDFAVKWAAKNNYGAELVERAGLIMRKPEEDRYYDRFRNRLMFPICDEQDRVIGFSGRTLEEDAKTAKYVNSPDTLLFHKSRILYALAKARRHMVEAREALICEGQIDVIRCHQAGFRTAVASQGTAFTDDHCRIIQRYADSVVLVFDPDTAGRDAAVRTAQIFMQSGLSVRVAVLPPKQDPDLYIRKHGADAFRKVLDNAVSAVGFQISVLSERERVDTEVGVMRVAKAVLGTIAHSPNAVQREKLVQEAAQRLNMRPTALLEELRKILRRARGEPEPEERKTGGAGTHPREELELCEHLGHIVDCRVLGELVEKFLPLDMLADPMCRTFADAALKSAGTGGNIQDYFDRKSEMSPEVQDFVTGIIMAPNKTVGRDVSHEAAVKDLILYIWRRALEKERADIDKGSGGAADQERRRQITIDLKSLKTWESGLPIIEIELAQRKAHGGGGTGA